MEKAKSKNSELNIKRYWLIYIPITIMMLLSLRFPLRIMLNETLFDIYFYGGLSGIFLLSVLRVYQLNKWKLGRLLALINLCASLSAWHVIDLGVLRKIETDVHVSFGNFWGVSKPYYEGVATYTRPFLTNDIGCNTLFEHYIGNMFIAIAYRSWDGCENS